MLEIAEEAAEVGRCDADAICASDRAARVKPVVVSCSAIDSQILDERQPYTSALAHASPSSAPVRGSLTTAHCIAPDLTALDTARPSPRGALSRRRSWCCAPLFRTACYRGRIFGAMCMYLLRAHTNLTAMLKWDWNRSCVKATMGGREVQVASRNQAWRGKAQDVIGWAFLTRIIPKSSIFRNIDTEIYASNGTNYTCRAKRGWAFVRDEDCNRRTTWPNHFRHSPWHLSAPSPTASLLHPPNNSHQWPRNLMD